MNKTKNDMILDGSIKEFTGKTTIKDVADVKKPVKKTVKKTAKKPTTPKLAQKPPKETKSPIKKVEQIEVEPEIIIEEPEIIEEEPKQINYHPLTIDDYNWLVQILPQNKTYLQSRDSVRIWKLKNTIDKSKEIRPCLCKSSSRLWNKAINILNDYVLNIQKNS